MALPDDRGAVDSDDPNWRDTWWFSASDIEKKRSLFIHALWSERQQRGRHTLALFDGDRSERHIVITTDSPFKSDLLTLDVAPYKSLHLKVPSREIDLVWTAWQSPIDFSSPPFPHRVMNSNHLQASGRAAGTVFGAPFKGIGHRDRTSGPRVMTKGGRTLGITLVGADVEAAFMTHVQMPGEARFCDAASGNSGGYTYLEGAITPRTPGDTTFLRYPDGTLGAIRIGDEEFEIEHRFPFIQWSPDGNLSDPKHAEPRIVYTTLNTVIFATSRRLGRFAGGYGESFVLTY